MHCHLYRVSISLIPTSTPPFPEHKTDLTYEPPSHIPIISSIITARPGEVFSVRCCREGDATDVTPDVEDLAFDVFLGNVWIGGSWIKSDNVKRGKPTHLTRTERIIGGLPGIIHQIHNQLNHLMSL